MRQGSKALVFGATGQQGGAVARALKARGWSVRAFVRDPKGAKARALAALGIEPVQGDLADVAAIEAAMAGVDGVFSVQPSSGQRAAYGVSDEQEIRYGTTIADSAAKQGVSHLVYSSATASGKGETGIGHFDSKTDIERHIQSLDVPSTIIRPSTFMEMLVLPGMGLDQQRISFLIGPEQSMQFIAVEDIGKIVAAILSDPDLFTGRTLEVSGDELTGYGLQEAMSKAAGRAITYHRFTDDLLDQNSFLGRLAELVDDGRLAGSADIDALRREFGGLLTFEAWLAGPSKSLFSAALQARAQTVALR